MMKNAAGSDAPLSIFIENNRQQRAALVLRNVAYVIEAHFELTPRAGGDDNEGKHIDIFRRRAREGRCFQQPYFGCREFPAWFSLLEEGDEMPKSALAGDAPRDLGIMLYDIDFANGLQPMFYRPKLQNGVIDVAQAWQNTGRRARSPLSAGQEVANVAQDRGELLCRPI